MGPGGEATFPDIRATGKREKVGEEPAAHPFPGPLQSSRSLARSCSLHQSFRAVPEPLAERRTKTAPGHPTLASPLQGSAPRRSRSVWGPPPCLARTSRGASLRPRSPPLRVPASASPRLCVVSAAAPESGVPGCAGSEQVRRTLACLGRARGASGAGPPPSLSLRRGHVGGDGQR